MIQCTNKAVNLLVAARSGCQEGSVHPKCTDCLCTECVDCTVVVVVHPKCTDCFSLYNNS